MLYFIEMRTNFKKTLKNFSKQIYYSVTMNIKIIILYNVEIMFQMQCLYINIV